MLKQWEDGPEDNEADEAESRGRGRREKDTRKGKVMCLQGEENEKKMRIIPLDTQRVD